MKVDERATMNAAQGLLSPSTFYAVAAFLDVKLRVRDGNEYNNLS